MATLVEELRNKLRATSTEIREFSASFEDKAPTPDDEQKLDAMLNGQADLRDEIARAEKFAQAQAGNGHAPSEEKPNPAKAPARQVLSLGDRFVASPEFTEALKAYAPGGQIPSNGGFKMPALAYKGLSELRSALITGDSSTSGGAFVITDRFAEIQALGRQPLTLLDIIRRLQTSSDLVDYVAQTSRTNAAATVAEATTINDGAKPESAAAFEVRQAPVKTIANWIPVTKQAVADVPQLRGIIDTELLDNLRETLEAQILNGTGSGSQMTGITQTSGTQTQAWDTNILTTTRKAKTIVRTVGRTTPTAYVLNPGDWETIDLLQDNEARYFYGGPAQAGIPRLWGLPVVESEGMTVGAALVGNFNKAILWDREAASIAISDSHSDFFVRNLLAILAELRAAFALVQPNAIVEIDVAA